MTDIVWIADCSAHRDLPLTLIKINAASLPPFLPRPRPRYPRPERASKSPLLSPGAAVLVSRGARASIVQTRCTRQRPPATNRRTPRACRCAVAPRQNLARLAAAWRHLPHFCQCPERHRETPARQRRRGDAASRTRPRQRGRELTRMPVLLLLLLLLLPPPPWWWW